MGKNTGGIIYCITNAVNGKQYVGKTQSESDNHPRVAYLRWRGHVSCANCGDTTALAAAIRKYGESAFTIVVVTHCEDHASLCETEIGFIAEYKTLAPNGYNLTTGGEGAVGYHHTEEWKKQRSALMKGSVRADLTEAAAKVNRGKKRPPEVVEKISSMHKGKRFNSDAHMRRLWDLAAKANRGRKESPEVRARKKATMRARGTMITFDGKTQCLTAWSEETGLAIQTIYNRLIRNWTPERILTTPPRGRRLWIIQGSWRPVRFSPRRHLAC